MPSPTPIWKGYSGLIEQPDSGGLKLSDRAVWSFSYRGTRAHAYAYAAAHTRGTMGTVDGVSCFVEDCSISIDRGAVATVIVQWCRIDILPPDEFSITPVEVNPPITKNSAFSALSANDLNLARGDFQRLSASGQSQYSGPIEAASNKELIRKLVQKWLKGAETYYLAGVRYQWVKYYASLSGVSLRLGGYRLGPADEYPGSAPGLALLPSGGWLRQCDEVVWNNGIYKLVRTWIWGPSGYWDTDLYNTTPV